MIETTKKQKEDKKLEKVKEMDTKITDDNKQKSIQDQGLGKENQNNFRQRKRFRREKRAPRMEFEQKMISIRRVTRVVAGGRRFTFSVTLVIGDKKGSVGVGMGKASDTALAIEKAYNNAKRAMIQPVLNDDMSIPHEVRVKYTASEIFIKPAPGKGMIAGGSVRTVLELAGVTDINAKIFSRSKNPFNNAKATIKALSELKPLKKNSGKNK